VKNAGPCVIEFPKAMEPHVLLKREICNAHAEGSAVPLKRGFMRVMVFVFLCVGFPRPASAQQPADTLAQLSSLAASGDVVVVTDESGKRLKGKIDRISATSLRLSVNGEYQDIEERSIREVTRKRLDSLKNGAWIGAGAGAGVAVAAIIGTCSSGGGCHATAPASMLLVFVGGGAGAGALIDRFVQKSERIFVATGLKRHLRLQPFFKHNSKGLQFTAVF
jgi:hypothetical protein